MGNVKPENYRKDIDGLRAIAVLSVVIFHMGYLPNGYLGVDIFFAISGYLITKIVYNEALEDRFSIMNFYMRRIRRIIPLVLFTTLVVLITALFVMLPDDLENLSQSVVATNLFANNALLRMTSGDYWDIFNDYKPLMHTWSLGVEEQFYLIYPLIFLLLTGARKKWILPLLIVLTVISLYLFFSATNTSARFYLIQYRFFELALGGLGAIVFRDKAIDNWYKVGLLLIVLFVLLFEVQLPAAVKLLLVVLSSVGLLLPGNTSEGPGINLLEHPSLVWVGKISFSLYMWHQVVFAYSRYFLIERIDFTNGVLLIVVVFLLSVLSYYFIEQPFRDKVKVSARTILFASAVVMVVTSVSSLFIYMRGGVVRDVPELGLYAANSQASMQPAAKSHIHQVYNSRVYDLDKQFTGAKKVKALVIGNSYARDWSNILLESKHGQDMEICYTYDANRCKNMAERFSKADIIFFAEIKIDSFWSLARRYDIDMEKVWIIGNKNFGANNGIFYNKRGNSNYCAQRVNIRPQAVKINEQLKAQWGDRYIDLIGMVIDSNGRVPVFTDNCMFISQDTRHLTRAGATYFARLLDNSQTFAFAGRAFHYGQARAAN